MKNNKIKIAMVTDGFYPNVGGSETAIRKLSENFINMGHETIVYGVFPEIDNPNPKKIKVIKIDSRILGINFKVLGHYWNLNKEIKKFKPDVINAHFMLKSGYLGVRVAKKNNIASVVTVRGKGVFYKAINLKEKILFYIYRRMSLKADKMIATSAEMADIVKERWGRQPIPLSNGVDIDHFNPSVVTDLRKKFNLQDKKIILCVRRLVPKNGIEYMVRAMPKILEREKNAYLILVAPKKRKYKKLKNLTEELGINDKVMFPGEIDHTILPQYYVMADIVVQPSIAEARSLSCLEAMASGSAIIVTNTGGLPELIEHKVNGYIIPAFEASTYQVGAVKQEGVVNLSNAVLKLLSDDQLREKIKVDARKSAEAQSWNKICQAALSIYKQAIDINQNKV